MHGPNGNESLRPIFFRAILIKELTAEIIKLTSNVLYVQKEPHRANPISIAFTPSILYSKTDKGFGNQLSGTVRCHLSGQTSGGKDMLPADSRSGSQFHSQTTGF